MKKVLAGVAFMIGASVPNAAGQIKCNVEERKSG